VINRPRDEELLERDFVGMAEEFHNDMDDIPERMRASVPLRQIAAPSEE
jgi:hypothetical protein